MSKEQLDRAFKPITVAISEGNLSLVKELVNAGDSLLKQNLLLHLHYPSGTLLHVAVRKGKVEIVTFLIREEPKTIAAGNHFGETPLYLAALMGDSEIFKILLQASPEAINIANNLQRTPLHAAAFYEKEEVVKILLKCNPELLNKKDKLGQTAIDLVKFWSSNEAMVRILIESDEVVPQKGEETISTPLTLPEDFNPNLPDTSPEIKLSGDLTT